MAKKVSPTLPTISEVMAYLESQSGPVMKRNLSRALGIRGDHRVGMKKILREMNEKGLIHTENKGHRIMLTDKLPDRIVVEVTGIDSMGDVIAHPFEWKSDKPAPQIIITQDNLTPPVGVGDMVQVEIKDIGNRIYHGKTLRRVAVGNNTMVAVYEDGRVYSVDRRLKQSFLLTGVSPAQKLKNRDLVLIDIPTVRGQEATAAFVRKIGTADDPFVASLIAIYTHNLPVAFTERAEKDAAKAKVPSTDKNRVDMRSVPFVTIDGADARDFDDAVWAEADTSPHNKGGYHILIGIADVCWYVRPETPLDADARIRGNSVYFPDRVLPMLPEALSNGVCSLNPNEPRAALVCEVWINANGNKIRHTFHRALIQSVRRLTYDEVQSAMDGHTPIVGLETEIRDLTGAYQALKKNRIKRGVLEIDVPEKQVVLSKDGTVKEVRFRSQIPSMQLIEELMILANVSAAETLEEKGAPVMYRVHARPSDEKIMALKETLSAIGRPVSLPDAPVPADFNGILSKQEGGIRRTVHELVLRSQSQAAYSPENIGHFGLALAHYAHFTSPIRRYADILVHRSLVKALKLGDGGLSDSEAQTFDDLARHISATERRAATAEMETIDRYLADYLKKQVGKTMDVRITSVTAFGIFVSVESCGADGFVSMRYLPGDYYDYEQDKHRVVGRSTGYTYGIGDRVRAILRECVPITGGLLFQILPGNTSSGHPTKASRKKKTSRLSKG